MIDGGDGFDTVFGQFNAASYLDLADQSKNGGVFEGDIFIGVEAFSGSAVADRLVGDSTANAFAGNMGADTLRGRGGDDVLGGGIDEDLLTGGKGDDTFVLFSNFDPDADTITDFGKGDDLLEVWANLFGVTEENFVLVSGSEPTASGAGPQFLFDTDDGRLQFDEDGAGGEAPHLVATLLGVTSLSAEDFVFTGELPGVSASFVI